MYIKLPLLAQIAKEAGDEILRMQPKVVANKNGEQERKSDGSLVTAADKKANEIVCAGLKKYFPNIAIVSEENSEADNTLALKADERFDTDPLDNTSGYVKNLDGFSVNIGRIKDGVPIEGVIYFPKRKEMYYTDKGKAYLQKGDAPPKEISVRTVPLSTPLEIAVGFNEQNIPNLGGREYNQKEYPAQLRTCMVATGECHISGINRGRDGGFNSWDMAGPHAVLRRAGGELVDEQGEPIRYPKNTIKVPSHMAGGKDVLIALGLGNAASLNSGRNLG